MKLDFIQIRPITSGRRPLLKKPTGGAVERANIPVPLTAIYLISILGFHSTRFSCIICLWIDIDNMRMPFTALRNSS